MRETWVRSLGQEVPLEKEMATHSSILAWRIPRTEEPGRLQFMGSQRVRHDWATSLSLHYVKTLFLPLPSRENFDELSFLPGQNLNPLFGVVLFTLFLQSRVMTSLSPYFSTLFSTFLRVTEMSYVFDHHMSEMTHLSLFHHHSRTIYHLNYSTKINYLLWLSLYVISYQLFPSLVIIIQFFLCVQ